jgi:hypothetical protein
MMKWSDWNCFKCGTLNFSKRTVCLTCDCSRKESESLQEERWINGEEGDLSEDKSAAPSNGIGRTDLNLSQEIHPSIIYCYY